MKLNKFTDLTRQVWAGKSIGRILMNWVILDNLSEIRGDVLDLASGAGASYKRYLPESIKITTTDLKKTKNVDLQIDLNEKLPLADKSYHTVFLFNAIYTLSNREATLAEIYRVLSDDGLFVVVSPFIFSEAREPHDFIRLTSEGLLAELGAAGFTDIKLLKIGERFTSVIGLLWPFLYFRIVKLLFASAAILSDRIIPAKLGSAHPAPFGYLSLARKRLV